MLEATRRWFRRNRTVFAFGLGAVGAVYFAAQYAWGKWLEAQQRLAEDRIAKENLRRRFEQNQEDCTFTVLALLPTVRDEIMGAYPVEDISNELQQQRAERLARSAGGMSDIMSADLPSGAPSTIGESGTLNESFIHASQLADSTMTAASDKPKRTKVQLWEMMKIQSISRALTLIYTVSLLTLLTRIQLNLLGRRTYLSSVVSLASPPPPQQASTISLENNDDDNYDNVYGSDFETNRKYLTFSWWLLRRGSKDIAAEIEAAVREVFGSINPREELSLERLAGLVLEVRKRVEGVTESERSSHKWLQYLLPRPEDELSVLREPAVSQSDSPDAIPNDSSLLPESATQHAQIGPQLRRLLDETSDFVDSPVFTHVLTQMLNAGFAQLVNERIAIEAFKLERPDPESLIQSQQQQQRITEIVEKKVKLAQILAVFCRQAHVMAAGVGDSNDFDPVAGRPANEYLAAIDQVKDLQGFAAVIYSSNFEFESAQADVPEVLTSQRQGALAANTGPQRTDLPPAFQAAWNAANTSS